jgi:hypothetical protein
MQASSAGKPAPLAIDRRELSAALRAQVFNIRFADVGGSARASGLYGAMVETALADAVVSVVALADGSVSLYVSDGSGCIGCGTHADVRVAAADFLQAADHVLTQSKATDDFVAPVADQVRVFLLTESGVRSLHAPLSDVRRSASPLGQAYFAALSLLQVVERTGAGRSLQAEIDAAANIHRAVPTAANENEPCLSVGNAVRRLRI